MIYVLVTGSRFAKWSPWAMFIREGILAHVQTEPYSLVIGGAKGIDSIAEELAGGMQPKAQTVHRFPADWKAHGKAAGPRRNQQMLDFVLERVAEGHSVVCLAFHDDLGASKGTRDMVRRATVAGIPVKVDDGKAVA